MSGKTLLGSFTNALDPKAENCYFQSSKGGIKWLICNMELMVSRDIYSCNGLLTSFHTCTFTVVLVFAEELA